MPNIFKVGVVGFGLSAKVFIIPFVQTNPRFELYSIVQRNPTDVNDATKLHPGTKVFRKYSDLLNDPQVDLVVISSATHTHYELSKLALESGKNVLCEKPFTLRSQEADELIAIANSKKLLLTVFHNRRWDTDFLMLSSLIRENVLGQIVEFESHFDINSPAMRDGWSDTWRARAETGSGVLYDLGSHLIDQVLVLFGSPQSVTALLYHQKTAEYQYGDPDSMTILLRYSDGNLVTLKASVINVVDKVLRFKVRGRKGTYIKYHQDVQESQIVSGAARPGEANFGVEDPAHFGTISMMREDGTIETKILPQDKPLSYGALFDAVADALEAKESSYVTAESARDVVRLIELAQFSAQTGRTIKL